MAGFVALIVVVGAALGALVGSLGVVLAVAFLLAVGLAGASYLCSDQVVLSMSKARPAPPDQHPRYHNLVEGLCVAGGLPKPALYLIDDDAPNSFACGRSPRHGAVAVTTGLLEKLSRIELEGVLAHELAHIANRDTVLTSLAVARRREAIADLTGVRLTRYPPGLISALEKLRADKSVVRGSRAIANLWIESPTDPGELETRIAALRDL